MSDMHDTRRLHGGGVERESKQMPRAAKVSDSGRLAWLEGECGHLRARVTGIGDALGGIRIWNFFAILAVCVILLGLMWRQQSKFEERIQTERDATVEELKKVHSALYRVDEAVDDNRAAVAAVLTPAVTLGNFVERTRQDTYRGWKVGRMFDDLEVIHLQWDRALYGEYNGPQGNSYNQSEADQYLHLDHVLYKCAKQQSRDGNWEKLHAQLCYFVQIAQGEITTLESFRGFNHHSITERYDAERVIGVRYETLGEVKVEKGHLLFQKKDVTFYFHLDDATYALTKDMKTFYVRTLEDARNR